VFPGPLLFFDGRVIELDNVLLVGPHILHGCPGVLVEKTGNHIGKVKTPTKVLTKRLDVLLDAVKYGS